MGVYLTAQVCLNGHTITDSLDQYPERGAPHCPECGELTITKCPSCETNIRGAYVSEYSLGGWIGSAPSFCFHCGEKFPWTAAKLRAARELASELDELSTGEREVLRDAIDDLASDTPRTELAAHRYKRIAGKLGGGASKALASVVTEIATEAAKRLIFGTGG